MRRRASPQKVRRLRDTDRIEKGTETCVSRLSHHLNKSCTSSSERWTCGPHSKLNGLYVGVDYAREPEAFGIRRPDSGD